MDDNNTILKLQLITLFDSICFGLIYAFLNPYLLVVGGDHLTIGIFSVLYLLSQLISKSTTEILISNTTKYKSLFQVIAVAFISHVVIALTTNYWIIIFARCLFGLTNETNAITKDLILDRVPENQSKNHITLHNMLSSVGYIVGPIISGCLFSISFNISCLIAATLCLFNIWLILSIDEDVTTINKTVENPLIETTIEHFHQMKEDIAHSNVEKNWDLIALKYLFTASINIFYTKFTQILKHNFDSNAVVIGYTTAYMNVLTFVSAYFLRRCKMRHNRDNLLITKIAFVTLLLSITIACYSPTYYIYSVICLPMTLSRNYINDIWTVLFDLRKNDSLTRLNKDIGIVAGLTVPIFFGITCNIIQHHAVILFSVLPIMASLYIYYKYTIPSTDVELKEEADKNKND